VDTVDGPILIYGKKDGDFGDMAGPPKYVFPINENTKVEYSKKNPAAFIFCSGKGYLPFTMESSSISEMTKWVDHLKAIIKRFTDTTGLHADYNLGKILGQGAFGTVYMCINKKTGEECAVKQMLKDGMSKDDILNVRKECQILDKVNHPNICRKVDLYQDNLYFHMVIELIGGEELFDRLTKIHHFGEKKVKEVMNILCSCLQHLDEKGILHRDLKPQNIMMTSKAEDAQIKLIDFGLGSLERTASEISGSPVYMAPEMASACLPQVPPDGCTSTPYTTKVDVWSMGVIHYQLMSGVNPFIAENPIEVFKKIVEGNVPFDDKLWGDISKEGIMFIKCMLTVDPDLRYSAKQLLRHEWFFADTRDVHLAAAAKGLKLTQAKRQLSTALRTARAMLAIKLPSVNRPTSPRHRSFEKQASSGKSLAHLKIDVDLTEEEKKSLKEVFNIYDKNGDGGIDELELMQVFLSLGKQVTEEEVHAIMSKLDVSGDGSLDFEEFAKYMGGELRAATETHNCAIEMFQSLDPQDTGSIFIDEFRNLLWPLLERTMEKDTFEDLMKSIDEDGNGRIDLEEFAELFDVDAI